MLRAGAGRPPDRPWGGGRVSRLALVGRGGAGCGAPRRPSKATTNNILNNTLCNVYTPVGHVTTAGVDQAMCYGSPARRACVRACVLLPPRRVQNAVQYTEIQYLGYHSHISGSTGALRWSRLLSKHEVTPESGGARGASLPLAR
ncbi:hypothetical protein E2C01_019569 [Portunus trituberculatus]|uniref:Uncharacterized protein n=1 Tax=Portunus trituberculatus TaxID=210409 RepID=A0A5B7DXZ4_PORTR|nr:hypothetical protein [Portunus trituberculatus]